MSQSDVSLYGETEYDLDPGIARCDLCGLTSDHEHSWEEWGFTVEAGPFDGPEALPAPTVAEMDQMAAAFDDECPAGGRHVFVERETWDHRIRWGCDECGATPPERDDY